MKKIRRIIKNYLLLISVFSLLMIALFSFFRNNLEEKILTHNLLLQKQWKSQYDSVYDNFKKLSENTFYGIVNKANIYNNVKLAYKKDPEIQKHYRDKLYQVFEADYSRLLNYNFKQLHFHFPDSTSFLRMHKPSKYGDSLVHARYSVVQANKTLKPINGFERGKVVHGFRFVYPLYDENLIHIGSVEVSVSSDFFEKVFEKNYEVDAHFLTRKDALTNLMFKDSLVKQQISDENDEYFLSKETNDELLHFSYVNFYSNKELSIIKNKMRNSESFIFTKNIKSDYLNIYFIPISNVKGERNSAYLVLYKKSIYIEQIYTSFYTACLILFLICLLFLVYINYKHNKDEKLFQKDEVLSQQSKMASMGEMLENIAHQWRQPLSVISTSASGMIMQKEFGLLKDEHLLENLNSIVKSTKYLSETIDDFRNFFSSTKERKEFNLKTLIEESLNIFGPSLKTHNIIVVNNSKEIKINTFSNELKQVIVNLLKNAKDAIIKDGLILIQTIEKDDIIRIIIKDSGGGISIHTMAHVFEPYFTTKYKSQGTGLGLFMSYEIVNKSLHGTLTVTNETYQYNFKNFTGACFVITLNKNKL